MRRIAILLFFVNAFCSLAEAQNQQGVMYKMYNMKGSGLSERAVNSQDSADFLRIIFPQDSTDNLFLVNDYYKNKQLKMIGKTINPNPNYINLQGMNREFFPNGVKKADRNFDHNQLTGDFTEYFPNGKIYLIGNYNGINSLLVNECRDSTGKVLATKGAGHCIIYNEDFKSVVDEGELVNQKRDGEWRGVLGDSIRYVVQYKGGICKNGVSYNGKGKQFPFREAEIEPSFNDGIGAFVALVEKNIRYPVNAVKNNVQGKVMVTFVVEKDGSLSNVKVIRGIGSGCDEEAVRLIELSPPWNPGLQYGIPVRVQYTIPISFTMQN